MTFDEYQAAALRTANPNLDLCYALGKMCSESGEAMQLLCKAAYHKKQYADDDMISELGDVLWHIALAAKELGYSMDDIAAANIAKLRARHGDTYNAAHYTGEAQ